jgi:PAS domain S-box-containing protein
MSDDDKKDKRVFAASARRENRMSMDIGRDNAERSQTEERLREYEKVVENLEEMIVVVDRDYRYLLANRAFLKYRGMQREQIVGRPATEILDPEVFARVLKPKLDECFQGKVVRYELNYGYPEIGERVLAISYFPIEGPTGIDRVACVLRDITERKRAEELLRQSESQLASAQHLAHVGSWSWELKSNTVRWSDELYSIYGVQPNDFTPSFEEFLGRIQPEDRDSIAQSIKDSLTNCEPFSHYERILLNDGEVRVLQSSGNVICDEQGQPLRMFGACQDITEQHRAAEALRKAEQKYRDIFENAGEGIFQSTPDGQYIAANPALARMHGFDSPEELIQRRYDISRQIYVDPERRAEFKRLLEEQGAVRGFEHQIYRKDGSKIWISVNARAVRDEQGRVIYYEGTSQDITERKRADARSAAFATLARKLSGARTQLDAGRIIAKTAGDLFGWDSCNLDLYDADRDIIHPMLNVDTIDDKQVDVTAQISNRPPTARHRSVIDHGSQLILREEPITFDADSIPFGDTSRPSASLMTAPIRHASRVIGLLSIQSYSLHAYDQAALTDLEALADHCGEALNRIRAEELLHESEERYRDLVENSSELMCTHDLNGLVLSANPAAAAAIGIDLDQLVGKKNLRDILAPEARDQFEEYLTRIRENGVGSGIMLAQTMSGETRIWQYYNSLRTEGVAEPIVRGMARDITEERYAQNALRESEERFSKAFHFSPAPLIITRLVDGCFLNVNDSFLRTFGYEREEVIGKTVSDLDIYVDYEDRAQLISKMQKEGSLRGYESRARTKSGYLLDLLVFVEPVKLKGEQCILSTAYDITERKSIEEALRESEERYRELFENANDALYVHDLGGRYLSFNRAAERLSGYSREEILGKHFSNFVAPSYLRRVRENLCKKLDIEGETTYEIDLVTKDRRRVPVEVNSRLIFENGEPVGVQGAVRDITERKRADDAHHRLALIVDSSDDAIIGKTLDGTIISWNSGAEKIYGYSAKEIIGSHMSVLIPSDRSDELPQILERLRRGESVEHYETIRRRKDGKLIDVSLTMSPIRDGNKKPVGISTIARDITDAKQAEKALQTFSRRLIEAQEAERQHIARELHDEIGQVLTAVRINLQSLRSPGQANSVSLALDDSLAIVDEALECVRELSLNLRPSVLDNLGLASALRWYVDRYARRSGIVADLRNDIEDGQRLQMELETACFRIVQEALTNVVRHAAATRVSVDLKRSNGNLELKIKDNGVGFDSDWLLKSAGSSSALGLRGMQERTVALNGRLEIDSKPKSGTEIRVSFPLKTESKKEWS